MQEEVEDFQRATNVLPAKNRNPSGPRTPDPYSIDDSSMMLPVFVAIGAFIPLLFCLCKLWERSGTGISQIQLNIWQYVNALIYKFPVTINGKSVHTHSYQPITSCCCCCCCSSGTNVFVFLLFPHLSQIVVLITEKSPFWYLLFESFGEHPLVALVRMLAPAVAKIAQSVVVFQLFWQCYKHFNFCSSYFNFSSVFVLFNGQNINIVVLYLFLFLCILVWPSGAILRTIFYALISLFAVNV